MEGRDRFPILTFAFFTRKLECSGSRPSRRTEVLAEEKKTPGRKAEMPYLIACSFSLAICAAGPFGDSF